MTIIQSHLLHFLPAGGFFAIPQSGIAQNDLKINIDILFILARE